MDTVTFTSEEMDNIEKSMQCAWTAMNSGDESGVFYWLGYAAALLDVDV